MYTLLIVQVLSKKNCFVFIKSITFSLVALVFFQVKVYGFEYIADYKVGLNINSDSSVNVTEQITVNAEGGQIKRGIYRDFPTQYKTSSGYNKNTTFTVKNVTKNGEPEPYYIENIANGKRLYIGSSDVFLQPGIYNYQISYNTKYQIGYFDNHDELYFNAIGTGWDFPINKASVAVVIPAVVENENLKLAAYSGKQGTTNTEDVSISNFIEGSETKVLYVLNKDVLLKPGEGLTVVAGFPKGLVYEPTMSDQIIRFVKDNLTLILMLMTTLIGIIVVPGIYLYYWFKYGRDPKTRGVVRNYDIPKNISPAAARYISHMKFDNKALSTTIISLATKGYLVIKEDKKLLSKQFSLVKSNPKVKSALYPDEEKVYEYIFSNNTDEYVFDKKDYKKNQTLINLLKTTVEQTNKGKYVLNNSKYMTLPIIITVILFIVGVFKITLLFLLIPVHIVFYYLLKARTLEGKEVYDKILGLKQYLSAVEEPRYSSNIHEDIPFNIGVYEKYLPYAVALDVEPLWSKRLKSYIENMEDKKELDNHMLWYVGSRNVFDSNFASSVSSSLNTTINSSSTAPGSSSGFSGGSSGGGGGGGGGGGW